MNFELLNGHPRVTLIESFAGEVFVVRPGFRQHFKNLRQAQEFIGQQGWEVNISVIKGSPIMRKMNI